MESKGIQLLRKMFKNPKATFREGQWEAIDSVLNNHRTLVVQKTGWGKSLVYFLATRLLRDMNKGPTVLISPLLALMRDQLDSAEKLGLKSAMINSDNVEQWEEVKDGLKNGEVDILLISPERLFSTGFQETVTYLKDSIGMFVVDEAHCISDWGHDFRPDYRRIVSVLHTMPSNIPVLATTATANERVIQDIQEQIGQDLKVIRGTLVRESLRIQIIKNLRRQEERLSWLAENLPKIDGSGIIYCLTKGDCRRVTEWLRKQNLEVYAYYGNIDNREELELKLKENEIKALVSTTALGMGFDKEDLKFVIHYQSPGSVVSYYQQIGRAGRNLENADVILLEGEEDKGIQDFFISSSFPKEEDLIVVLNALLESDTDLTADSLEKTVNFKRSKIEKCLKFLEVDGAVVRVSSKKYRRSFKSWSLDKERVVRVTNNRNLEQIQMNELIHSKGCYMQFVAHALDDFSARPCGKCANCTESPQYPVFVSKELQLKALEFLRGDAIPIMIRKKWPNYRLIPEAQRTELGYALCMYGDSVYGSQVQHDKYVTDRFCDELVEAMVRVIQKKWPRENPPEWVTCVPSRRNTELVPDFAKRVASSLGLAFYPALEKVCETAPQKEMENSTQRVSNIRDAFEVNGDVPTGPVLLLDDIVDSAWTFTLCGVKLKQAGSGPVYPFALASAGNNGGDTE